MVTPVVGSLDRPHAGRPGGDAAPSGDHMHLDLTRQDRRADVVLSVRGELDVATVAALRAGVQEALAAAPAALHLDLSALAFIDSTGCRELLRAARAGSAAGTEVDLVLPPVNRQVRRIVEFMGFGDLLPVLDAVPEP